jgi:carbamoyltransferase
VRFSPAFPSLAIAAGLAHLGARPSDIEGVAFPWSRGMGRLRKAAYVARRLPRSLAFFREPPDELLATRRGYLREMGSLARRLRREGIAAQIHRVPHHLAHAASASIALPDATGAVLTADGMGEWTTAAIWRLRAGVPVRLAHASYPHSPGKVYAAVTAWLGFRAEADEGKTMGLAAYGDPDAPNARFTRALLRPDAKSLLRVDVSRLDFPIGRARLFGEAFLSALGPPRDPREPIRPGDADAARGVQDAVEAFALAAVR